MAKRFDSLREAVEAARARGALAQVSDAPELRRDAIARLESVGALPWAEHLQNAALDADTEPSL